MFRRLAWIISGALVVLTAPAGAQTVDEIIARYVAARGGLDKIRAIQTQRLTGHIAFGGEQTQAFRVEMKRPGMMRQEIGSKTGTIIQTTNGASGWNLVPPRDPVPLPKEALRNMA